MRVFFSRPPLQPTSNRRGRGSTVESISITLLLKETTGGEFRVYRVLGYIGFRV